MAMRLQRLDSTAQSALLIPIKAFKPSSEQIGAWERIIAMPNLDNPTPKFRHVRLLLAREKDHPAGDRNEGYDLVIPLDADNRIDAAEWKAHQAACRVRRFRRNEEDLIGRLRRKPGGQWYFDYVEGDADDEIGFRIGEERFVPGEYVSVRSGDRMHTFQVALVAPLQPIRSSHQPEAATGRRSERI